MDSRFSKALIAAAVAAAVLSPVACAYDYAALEGRKSDTGTGETGGSNIPIVGAAGSPGPVTHTGGAPMVDRADSGAGGGGGHAPDESSAGGGGSGGVGGAGGGKPIPPPASGGAIGTGTGGAISTGTGGAAGGGGTVVPRILSIDFVGGTTRTDSSSSGAAGRAGAAGGASGTTADFMPLPAMSPTEVAGVKPVAHWNSAQGPMGQITGLAQSDATLTAATATWNSPPGASGPGVWRNGFADAPGNTRMMNGYLDPLSTAMPATVTVSNLPADMAAAGYDVYVYCVGEVPSGTRTYRYAIGTSSITVAQTGPSPTTFSGFVLAAAGGSGNYIVFRNVTGSAFTLTATPAPGTIPRAPVNGIQLVSPPGS